MGWSREDIAARAARELKDGFPASTWGIGIPTTGGQLHPCRAKSDPARARTASLGMGPFPYPGEEDPDLINAGKQTITELPDHQLLFRSPTVSA